MLVHLICESFKYSYSDGSPGADCKSYLSIKDGKNQKQRDKIKRSSERKKDESRG